MIESADATSGVLRPEVVNEIQDGEHWVLELRVNESLAFFPGHFPDVPILPGVVQVQWAIEFGRQRFAPDARFQHMEVIKFKALIRPGQCVSLYLRYSANERRLQFAYRSDRQEFSSGRIYFRHV